MRKRMGKAVALGVAFVMCVAAVCGCGKAEGSGIKAGTEHVTAEKQAEESNALENIEVMKDAEVTANTEAAKTIRYSEAELKAAKIRHYYGGVLSQLTCALQLPGVEISDFEIYNGGKMEQNQYAVTDIDKDGREELLIVYSTAGMAGMFEVMYDYNPDTDTLRQQFIDFPALTFYDNGVIKSAASHNHTMGMDFWPFTLYQYDVPSDSYTMYGYVDTWDKKFSDTFYGDKTVFPEELDTDGDGILYHIRQDWTKESHGAADYRYNAVDYEKWYEECMDDAEEMQIAYKPITYDNFDIYTKEYLKMLEENTVEEGTDIGLYYLKGNDSLDEVAQFLAENYAITLETNEEFEEETYGRYEEKEIFRFLNMDAGLLTYSNEKLGDITMFGLYPGMDETEAYAHLKQYGFYPYGETEKSYITGEGLGNRSLWYESEDGKITTICTHHFCAFAG